jgi:hypothetical protein
MEWEFEGMEIAPVTGQRSVELEEEGTGSAFGKFA